MPNKFDLDRREVLRRLLELSAAGVALSLSGCGTQDDIPAPTPTTPPATSAISSLLSRAASA